MQSSSKGSVAAEFSVYVGNLDPETPLSEMEELLYELFLQAGPLSHVLVPFNKETGKHKCYGFVEFLHKEFITVKPVQTSNSSLRQQQQTAMASTASATDAMEVQAQESTAMTVEQDAPPPPLMSINTDPLLAPLSESLIPSRATSTANVNPFLAALAQSVGLNLPLAPMSIPPHSSLPEQPTSCPPFTSPLSSRPSLMETSPVFPPSSSFPPFSGDSIPSFPPPSHTLPPLPPLTPSSNNLPAPFSGNVLPFGPPPLPHPPPPSLITPPPQPLFPSHQNEQEHFLMNGDIPPSSSFLQSQPLPSVPDLPLYHNCTPPLTPSTPSHFQLHESRLHSSDHPSWMKDEIKEKVLSYHLKELGTSLQSLHRTLAMKNKALDH